MKTSTTDAEGGVASTWYNHKGQVVKERKIAGGSESDKEYLYDLNGNLTQQKQGGQVQMSWQYNNMNQVVRSDFGAGDYSIYEYDPRGGVMEMVDVRQGQASETTTWQYDLLGRAVSYTYSGVQLAYGYDVFGNLTQIGEYEQGGESPAQTTRYDYDGVGRLSAVRHKGNSGGYKTVEEYAYAASGDLTSATQYLQFASQADKQGETAVKQYSYEARLGQLLGVDMRYDGQVKESHSATYDRLGMMQTESLLSNFAADTRLEQDTTYTYDSIGRLTQSVREKTLGTEPSETENTTYGYDRVGNRLSMVENNVSYAYTYNAKYELTGVTRDGEAYLAYQYSTLTGSRTRETHTDEDGVAVTDYAYDAANRLQSTSMQFTPNEGEAPDAVQTYNLYNGQGQRVKSSANSASLEMTSYYYSGSALMFTKDGSGGLQGAYVLRPDGQVIASREGGGTALENGVAELEDYLFYNYDMRGSVTNIVAVVKTTGDGYTAGDVVQVEGYAYDVFGKVTELTQSATSNEIKYTGGIDDSKTGLVYLNARHYDPQTGRFLQQDTYKGDAYQPWTQHLYSYCGNNPVNMVDPSGHMPDWLKKTLVSVAIVAAAAVTVAAVVATGGAAIAAVAAVAPAFGTIATAVTATVAAGVSYCAVSDVTEVWTGHNPGRDTLMGGNQQAYDQTKKLLNTAATGITMFGTAANLANAGVFDRIGAKLRNIPKKLKPSEIRYSQRTINGTEEITNSMKANGWQGDAIDVVKMPDGKLTTVDNTRVAAATQAKINVTAKVHNFNDPLPSSLVGRFSTPKSHVSTWGGAVSSRIANQGAAFRTTNPFGSYNIPLTK